MNPRLIHVPEPHLEFRFGQTVDYPRDGLYLFGPVDAVHERRQVRYGVIGTPGSLRRFKEWATQVSRFIDIPAPGRLSKAIQTHHVPFPGFGEAFHATWPTEPSRTITDIDEEDLRRRLNIENRHEAIKAEKVQRALEQALQHNAAFTKDSQTQGQGLYYQRRTGNHCPG